MATLEAVAGVVQQIQEQIQVTSTLFYNSNVSTHSKTLLKAAKAFEQKSQKPKEIRNS